jgi:hypothetical protein
MEIPTGCMMSCGTRPICLELKRQLVACFPRFFILITISLILLFIALYTLGNGISIALTLQTNLAYEFNIYNKCFLNKRLY